MKIEWKKPVLEVLDVSETMLSTGGRRLDNGFPSGTPIDEITTS